MALKLFMTFSNDGSLLAACAPNGVLKLWDAYSCSLEHEFCPGELLTSSVTCLQFSPKHTKNYRKPKKKKKNQHISDESEYLLAFGAADGKVFIYSPKEQKVIKQLTHSKSSVVDINWHSSLISISNKKLIVWNISYEKQCVLSISTGLTCCILGENRYSIGGAGLQFIQYDPTSKETSQHIISAHKTSIVQLVPIFLNQESQARYVVTAAESDRYVYVWSTEGELTDPVASFMVKDIVCEVRCMPLETPSSVAIAVVTRKGFLRLYIHHLNGSKNSKPSLYQSSLVIHSKTNNSTVLPIINAQFVSTAEIIVAYGTDLLPMCEKMLLQLLKDEVKLVRQDPSLILKKKASESELIKTVTPHIPQGTVHLMPTQMHPPEMKEKKGKRKADSSNCLPMEERLDALVLTQPLTGNLDTRPLDNYIHLLVQALHSKDTAHLNSILTKGEDEEVINKTVRKLPTVCVVPFLQYLQQVADSKGLKNLTLIRWVKSVLQHHMSFLSSLENKNELFKPFHAIFAARVSSLSAVAKLHSRISLLLTQAKNRDENLTRDAEEPSYEALATYEESDDEQDFRIELDEVPSEYEDIWDDFTEEEEEEEEEEEDARGEEEGEKGEKKKRKLPQEEDFISLSDDDDDDDEDNDKSENDKSDDDDDDVLEVSESD